MANTFDFKPSAFSKSLEEIRARFPLIKEVIYTKKTDESADLVGRLSKLDDSEIVDFALGLKTDELDLPLAAFKADIDNGQEDRLETILKIRFRKKLFLLNWLILQNNYQNQKLKDSMETLCRLMKEKYSEEYSETIFAKIGRWGDDPVRSVMVLFKKEGSTLEEFFKKYQLLLKSKFSYVFFVEYFINATQEEILNNRKLFILAANSYVLAESAAVLGRYLDIFSVREYTDDVMDIMVQKNSSEEQGNDFMGLFSGELKQKYKEWVRLRRMETCFGRNSKKYSFWANYLDDIQEVETPENSRVVFIYFGTCVVVDMGEPEQHAYLYYIESFRIEYERFMDQENGEERTWRVMSENVVDARESVIEGKRSDIYKLSYEFVGRLYLKEILHTEALRKKKRK